MSTSSSVDLSKPKDELNSNGTANGFGSQKKPHQLCDDQKETSHRKTSSSGHQNVKKPTRYDKLSTIQKYSYNHLVELNTIIRRRNAVLRSYDFNDRAPRSWTSESATSSRLAGHWQDQLAGNDCSDKRRRGPSLLRAIARTCGRTSLLSLICITLSDLICEPAIFFLGVRLIETIGQLNELKLLQSNDLTNSTRTNDDNIQQVNWSEIPQADYTQLYLYTFAFIFSLISYTLLTHPYAWLSQKTGLRLRVALSEMIYQKSLKIDRFQAQASALAGGGGGPHENYEQSANLIARDLSSLEDSVIQLAWAFTGPIQFVLYTVMISFKIDWATALVACFLNAVATLQRSYINMRLRKCVRLAGGVADKRKQLVDETLEAIRLVRMYAWTGPLEHKIDCNRREEMKHQKQRLAAKGYDVALFFISATAASLLALMFAHYARGLPFSQSIVSAIFLATATYRRALARNLSTGLQAWAQLLVTLERCQKFLLAPERATTHNDNNQEATEQPVGKDQPVCQLNQVALSWHNQQNSTCLKEINLSVSNGELILVAGQVGSGKSTLLELLLGELQPTSGSICWPASKAGESIASGDSAQLAYASQKAWIFSGTIRENILLGRQLQLERYHEVMRVSALLPDLCLFPDFDRTRIGERGVTLSGGQKARINLARALYQKAQVYLLDDPLSAVDGHVSNHIFNEALRGFLHDKTVILVTHQLQYLNQVDKILYVAPSASQEQQVNFFGTYNELEQSNLFGQLLAQLQAQPNNNKHHQQATIETIDRNYVLGRILSNRLDESMLPVASTANNQRDGNGHDEMWEITESRRKNQGHVLTSKTGRAIWFYLRNAGTRLELVLFVFVNIAMRMLFLGINIFLNFWAGFESLRQPKQANPSQHHELNWSSQWTIELSLMGALGVAWLMWLTIVLVSLIRTYQFYKLGYRAALVIHKQLIRGLLSAKLSFFDRTPQGHLINRLAADISYMDGSLVYQMDQLTVTGLSLGFVFLSIVWSLPKMALVVLILASFAYWNFQYLADFMELVKYLDGFRRAKLYSHVGATLDGLPVIRSARQSQAFIRTFNQLLDEHTSVRFLVISLGRYIIGTFDWLMILFYLALGVFLINETVTGNGLYAFVSVNLSIQLIRLAQNTLVSFVEFYLTVQSMDRIREYTLEMEDEKLQLCAPYIDSPFGSTKPARQKQVALHKINKTDKTPDYDAPLGEAQFTRGAIRFSGVSLKFLHTNKLVLDNVSFSIQPGLKVGIIGRTGAGKSSLATVLFHLYHFEGLVHIDDQDTKLLQLDSLRSSISIIPQDPSLFTGSIRHNLDPFEVHSDEKLWRALEVVHLKQLVQLDPMGLGMLVDRAGANFSVGQRQLICLARAILKENKILVMDEATSNIDQETDSLIQCAIRSEFKHCTVLTIAHRLSTVIDLDKLMIMQEGQMIEFGTPSELLARGSEGALSSIIDSTGEQQAKLLRDRITGSSNQLE